MYCTLRTSDVSYPNWTRTGCKLDSAEESSLSTFVFVLDPLEWYEVLEWLRQPRFLCHCGNSTHVLIYVSPIEIIKFDTHLRTMLCDGGKETHDVIMRLANVNNEIRYIPPNKPPGMYPPRVLATKIACWALRSGSAWDVGWRDISDGAKPKVEGFSSIYIAGLTSATRGEQMVCKNSQGQTWAFIFSLNIFRVATLKRNWNLIQSYILRLCRWGQSRWLTCYRQCVRDQSFRQPNTYLPPMIFGLTYAELDLQY